MTFQCGRGAVDNNARGFDTATVGCCQLASAGNSPGGTTDFTGMQVIGFYYPLDRLMASLKQRPGTITGSFLIVPYSLVELSGLSTVTGSGSAST